MLDYDRDGDPDFLVTQVDRHVQLFENRSQVGRWLTVAPTRPSQTVPGTEISVTVGGRTTTQVILAGGSYLAGPPPEGFGLGAARRADVVRVRWPGGRVTVLHDVPGGQVLHVSARS